ncbi:MAG: DUF4430 domain-containing protein [Candidatus Thermoplasmatota archaeon]|jgi:hypothetical protein
MIRPFALVVLLIVALAGCSATPEAPDESATPSTAPTSTQSAPIALILTLEQPTPTDADTITLRGTISKPAAISVIGSDGDGGDAIYVSGNTQANETWTVTLQGLRYGHTPVEVFADDGLSTALASATVVRMASVTIEVLYTAVVPPRASTTDTIWMDIDAFASAPAYEDKARPHPDFANVHDALVAWEAVTGNVVEYSYDDAFDFGVDKVNGAGNALDAGEPPYWGYKVNGSTADFGISLMPLAPDDVITWELATGV